MLCITMLFDEKKAFGNMLSFGVEGILVLEL